MSYLAFHIFTRMNYGNTGDIKVEDKRMKLKLEDDIRYLITKF
jgi:hypothetical protein